MNNFRMMSEKALLIITYCALDLAIGFSQEPRRENSGGEKIVKREYLVAPLSGKLDGAWPQWRGPNRNGIVNGTTLLKEWPSTGPKVIWRRSVGEGYSSIVVKDDRLYVGYAGPDNESLYCVNTKNGKELWKFKLNPYFPEEMGSGPRGTPVIDGARIYAQGSYGILHAINAKTGQPIWKFNLHDKPTEKHNRGHVSSPLIEGDLVLINGGKQEARTVNAFNKFTGELVWSYENGPSSFSSPLVMDIHGKRQIVSFIAYGLVGLDPETGEELWKFQWATNMGHNITTPLFFPPSTIFISSAYEKGAALLSIVKENNGWRAEQVWANRLYRNHFASSVAYQGYLYGFDNTILKCIDIATGKEQWKARGFTNGSLILADNTLIVLGEKGELGLIEATPGGAKVITKAKVLDGKCWTVPTLANGKLYIRNKKELVCLDISGESE